MPKYFLKLSDRLKI